MNTKLLVSIGLLAAVFTGGFAIGHRKPQPVLRPPVTVIHDTVTVKQFALDTQYITKYITKEAKPDTVWLDRVVTAKPETLHVVPELWGMTLLKTGQFSGDTTKAVGFHVKPDSSMNGDYEVNGWESDWISPGPLSGFILDAGGRLRMGFQPAFPQACTVKDKAEWGAIGAGGITLVRALLGR